VVSGPNRQSAYLVWKGTTVKPTQAVSGLGENLESDESVSRICGIKLQRDEGGREYTFCKVASHLFEYDSRRSCYRYSDKYEVRYREYIKTIMNGNGPAIEKCAACDMKRDETPEML
jgi:tRNA A37 threonylcarbamoyladenosine synthetase subunit TsaC/SUA5/YrdC